MNTARAAQRAWSWYLAREPFQAYAARALAAQVWASLPGPWWVKLALIVACQAIPGPLDELALVALAAAWRRYRAAHKPAPSAGQSPVELAT